jgi:cytochrome oxidase assembly protein ShyY1
MLAQWRVATTAAARPLAATLEQSGALPVRVVGGGRYVAGATVLLDNQVRDGHPGVMVISLFQPDGAHHALLVNRGWIALDARRQLEQAPADVAAEADVAGLLSRPPSAGLRVDNVPWQAGAAPPMLNWLDLGSLAQQFGHELYPGVLLLDDGAAHGYARGWQPLPNTMPPERHRGYAVQWFGLALTVLVVYAILWKKRKA